MSRLTEKRDKAICGWQYGEGDVKGMTNKLGQLEDIEEELGIDLITLFKALKKGIWTKGGYYSACILDAKPIFVKGGTLLFSKTYYSQRNSEDDYESFFSEDDVWCIFSMCYEDELYVTRLQDYGKTWALTKSELENEL